MTSLLSGPLSITDLLQHKRLNPLDTVDHEVLKRIQSLDVSCFSEADVREEIVSPLLKILEYDKTTYFSIERTKPIQLLGRNNYLDYNLTLWSENFWLIEAKKPKGMRFSFGINDIRQAVNYAVHPDINAALVVLCDGRKIAIFDREEDQREPALTVLIKNLDKEIDKLRAILSPWQVWFFEKRRIVRHLDKVFDREFNINRLEEFKNLMVRRLDSKRCTVINNMRSVLAKSGDDENQTEAILITSDPVDLIEWGFLLQFSERSTTVMAETLVEHCRNSPFPIINRVFPDYARAMNDNFCMHALNLLIHLSKENVSVNWLPPWLGDTNNLEGAAKHFLAGCLAHFNSDPVRRNILFCASALRRLFKIIMVTQADVWRLGEFRHVIDRYMAPEDSMAQQLSSPERQNLLMLDGLVNTSVIRLVRECSDSRGVPKPRSIEQRLRELWTVELALLESVQNYQELLHDRDMGEVYLTEATDVAYDSLGHSVLCVINHHATWKAYALEHHRNDVRTLACIGSWQAKKWLGHESDATFQRPSDQEMAERFFLGDVETFLGLKNAYRFA